MVVVEVVVVDVVVVEVEVEVEVGVVVVGVGVVVVGVGFAVAVVVVGVGVVVVGVGVEVGVGEGLMQANRITRARSKARPRRANLTAEQLGAMMADIASGRSYYAAGKAQGVSAATARYHWLRMTAQEGKGK